MTGGISNGGLAMVTVRPPSGLLSLKLAKNLVQFPRRIGLKRVTGVEGIARD
jgi:hypothetical protein